MGGPNGGEQIRDKKAAKLMKIDFAYRSMPKTACSGSRGSDPGVVQPTSCGAEAR